MVRNLTSDIDTSMRLTIDRCACQYNIPNGIESVAAARDCLTRIVERDVPTICGAIVTSLPGDDEAVYRIRHLHLNLWVDLQGMSEAEITQRWGGLLAKAVMQAMQKGSSQQVRRFESPRHFITTFLKDLIDGRAWSCWYYEEFRLLQQLTVGAIAIQLLTARSAWISPILQDLSTTGHTPRLLERWNQGDIEQLWASLGFSPQPMTVLPSQSILGLLGDLSALWKGTPRSRKAVSVARARDRIRVWLAFTETHPNLAQNPEVASMIQALVDLAALLQTMPNLAPLLLMESGLYQAILRQIATGPVGDAVGWLVPLARTDQGRKYLARLAQIASAGIDLSIKQQVPISEAHTRASHPVLPTLSSSVGSVFLLLLALVESGFWERWQHELGESLARRYLFIVALKALGREQAPMLLGDPVLATFAGLSEPPVADARLSLEAETLELGQTLSALGAWTIALPEIAHRWYPANERVLTLGTASNLQVLRDTSAGCWLAAWPILGSDSFSIPDTDWPELSIDPVSVRHNLTQAEQDMLTAEILHLQLGQRLGYPWLTPILDAALSAVTSFILRRTAAQLPRFHQSSPAYIARQFLAQPASIHSDTDLLTVRLSGGPLSMVLSMASLPKTLAVPWLPQPVQFILPGRLDA